MASSSCFLLHVKYGRAIICCRVFCNRRRDISYIEYNDISHCFRAESDRIYRSYTRCTTSGYIQGKDKDILRKRYFPCFQNYDMATASGSRNQ
jgi:hypothetical protein